MEDLSKTNMKAKVRGDIADSLMQTWNELQNKHINGVPMSQEEEYKEVYEREVERVFRFLGF